MGHEVQFFSHLYWPENDPPMVAGEYFVYEQKSGAAGLLQTEFSRSRALKNLIAAVRAYRPDVIYLRWAMYAFPLQQLYAIAPARPGDQHQRPGRASTARFRQEPL